jgi:transcription initiation factor TFIIH subunit 2
VPAHSTREVVVVFGALISSDAGDIHRTIKSLVEDKVRVRVVGLAAQVAVCRELCRATNAGDECMTIHYHVDLSDLWCRLERTALS